MTAIRNATNESVLITGGSGMIGRYLTSRLLEAGYSVSHLSRGTPQFGKVRVYRWNPAIGYIDISALQGIDHIIHLAGENTGEGRWTRRRKEAIIRSRVESAGLLHRAARETGALIRSFITASGSNYYGTITSDRIFTESDPPAGDFLGITGKKWEEAADLFQSDGIRTVKIRTALVLEKNDSAMTRITMPARFGFLARAGNGNQYMPWIHIEDLCGIYLKSVADESMNGPYNAVSPHHVTHGEFIKTLSSVMKKFLFPLNVPSFVMKLIYGEMADVVLKGSRISSGRIRNAGYRFEFEDLENALEDIFRPGKTN